MQIKLFITGLFCLLCSQALYADYQAKDLNKLFTDKKQRARIDATRSGLDVDAELQQTSRIKVSGYMIRSDGNNVVWINNKNTLDSPRIGEVRVQPSSIGKNKKITVTVDGKSRQLKPGETWNKDSGVSDLIK